MQSGAVDGDADLRERELALTSRVTALQEQLRDALIERSEIRSTQGDSPGAVEDAEHAQALWPSDQEVLFDCKHPSKKKRKRDAHGAHDRRLHPFDPLPDEIVALIFAIVMQDWEELPSPLQLTHVNHRWRSIAHSTPALWRDLRILRVWDQTKSKHRYFNPQISLVHRLGSGESKSDDHHLSLVKLCSERSHGTFTHFELEVGDFSEASEAIVRQLLAEASRSRDRLESLSLLHVDCQAHSDSPDEDDDTLSSSLALATLCLDLVFRCPNIVNLELTLSSVFLQGDDHVRWQLSDESFSAAPTPSLRLLKLRDIFALSDAHGPRTQDHLLARAAQLDTLVITHVSYLPLSASGLSGPVPFALRVLASCASTLVKLETGGNGNILRGMRAIGIMSLPALRCFRCALHDRSQFADSQNDFAGMSFPQLKLLEAPADVIAAFPTVPVHVILRLDSPEDAANECGAFSSWLLNLDDDQSPRRVSVLVTYENPAECLLYSIIASLTPSHAGKVACPRLEELKIVFRAALPCCDPGECHSLETVSLPKPAFYDEWRVKTDVSDVALMEQERRHVSQGLAPDGSALSSDAAEAEAAERWTICEALTLIELESCWIGLDDWEQLQASPCSVKASLDPDQMLDLGWRSDVRVKMRKLGDEEDARAS